jgi:hypothetical protein
MSPRRKRPCRRTAAQQRDKVAPFHCPMSPVLPTDRIPHLGGPGDRCIAGSQTYLCPLADITPSSRPCPLYPRKRTSTDPTGMSG